MHFVIRKKSMIIGAIIATIAFSFGGNASFLMPTFMNPVQVILKLASQKEPVDQIAENVKRNENEVQEYPVISKSFEQLEDATKRQVHQKLIPKDVKGPRNQWVWKVEEGQSLQVYMDECGKIRSDASALVGENDQILLRIHRKTNRIYVYEMDEMGKYSKAIKVMLCSTGKTYTPTKMGEYTLKKVARWHKLNGNVYGQYCCRISDHYLIHSVFYSRNGNPKTLYINEYLKLGHNASHGCVRVTVADAKWIYEHSEQIRVLITDENVYFPLEDAVLKEPIRVNGNRGIDPTDIEALSNP